MKQGKFAVGRIQIISSKDVHSKDLTVQLNALAKITFSVFNQLFKDVDENASDEILFKIMLETFRSFYPSNTRAQNFSLLTKVLDLVNEKLDNNVWE
ncbi:hypothetical protein ACSFBI_05270 [Variovorax sp. RB3P1]|uniref:hypothetical protein n=1 Tax=Variovorax sp. RB3P1 TaxID=3443732 RepID=UPI003F47F0C1